MPQPGDTVPKRLHLQGRGGAMPSQVTAQMLACNATGQPCPVADIPCSPTAGNPRQRVLTVTNLEGEGSQQGQQVCQAHSEGQAKCQPAMARKQLPVL